MTNFIMTTSVLFFTHFLTEALIRMSFVASVFGTIFFIWFLLGLDFHYAKSFITASHMIVDLRDRSDAMDVGETHVSRLDS